MSLLNRVSTTDALVDALRDQIVSGELPPGTVLPEQPLGQTFGVARPTVRAAVQTLVFEGLLRREPNRSAYVPRLTSSDVRDLFLVRIPLELHAVSTLIERGVRPLAAERALEPAAVAGREPSWTEQVDAVLGFHRGLVDAVESPRLTRTFAMLEIELRLCLAQWRREHGGTLAGRAAEHRRILDAIVSGDRERALEMLREHLEEGARLSLESAP
ncbi:MAG: GntR family transcriptional regulator [Thermoleophilaceae bacterium]